VEEARITMDEGKRLDLYRRLNRIWLGDAVAAPLYAQIDLYSVNKRLAPTLNLRPTNLAPHESSPVGLRPHNF
jgi:hypothetical protein